MYVRMYVCMYECMYKFMYVCMYWNAQTFLIYVNKFMNAGLNVCEKFSLIRLICVCMSYTCICVCVCMYVCMYLGGESWCGCLWTRAREFGTRVRKQGSLFIFIHTHLLTYIHTYIHSYIHTYLIYISYFFFKSLSCWFNSANRPPTLRAESNVCMYVCMYVCILYVCMYTVCMHQA